jgi:putative endonuclease
VRKARPILFGVPHARRILGDAGEHFAERALVDLGWRIVARNPRTRYGEIDLVCHDGRGYVFVEVKTRRAGSFVAAVEAVGPRKLQKLIHLAEAWLALKNEPDAPWRLAVAALTVGEDGTVARIVDVAA